jgi:predicted DNA-binding transcriptional regulator AlpA
MHDDSARHQVGGNNPPDPIDDTIKSPLLSIPQARKYLGGLGQSTIYEKMVRGELEACRIGGRSFITRRSCDALITRGIRCSSSARAASRMEPAIAAKVAKARPAKRRLTPGKGKTRRDERAARP